MTLNLQPVPAAVPCSQNSLILAKYELDPTFSKSNLDVSITVYEYLAQLQFLLSSCSAMKQD